MNELIKIDYDSERPTVSGRELHEFLQVDSNYTTWFKRMADYGFTEGEDYVPILENRVDGLAGKPRTDHQLTIQMAKELCMIQRNERGKQARQYFISVENQWNSPDAIMQRALQIANARVKKLVADVSALTVANSALAVDLEIARPKAEFFDQLVDRNLLTSLRETAQELGVKERALILFLLEKKYLYRDKRGKLTPYAKNNNGWFEVKECLNEKTQWSGTQTLVTPKGREHFRRLMIT